MSKHDRNVDELDLQAYADGWLDRDPHRKAMVEAYLDERPDEQERVRAYRIIGDQIRAAYSEALDEPMPSRFNDLLMAKSASLAKRRRPSYAAVAAVVVAAAFGGWLAGSNGLPVSPLSPDMSDVVASHRAELERTPEIRRQVVSNVTGIGMHEKDSLIIEAPDLSDIGYSLDRTGSTELSDLYRTTLYYRDREGDVITLVLERPKEPADTAPTVNRVDDLQSAFWRDGAFRVVAIGDRIEPNIEKIRAAVDHAFQNVQKAEPPRLPFAAPLMAEDRTHSFGEQEIEPIAQPSKIMAQ